MSASERRTVAFIFARGGSKGLPGKNIRSLDGKPLIAYAIEAALGTPELETVIVSTDDPDIADISKKYGAQVPFVRPSELARDDSPEWSAWRHAIAWFQQNRGCFDTFISLPPTSPFRTTEDIQACITALEGDPEADAVITVTPSMRNPYFNMVTLDQDGYAHRAVAHSGEIFRRQDTPQMFDITTVAYAARPSFVSRAPGLFAGNLRAIHIPQDRSLDIDTPFDFTLAEAILARRKLTSAR
jgi:CMP-N-acetylneuraminic acid synthetase